MSQIHRVTRRPLSDFVDFLWESSGYTQPHASERVMPTGCMNLVLGIGNSAHISAVVSGARTQSFVLDTSRPLSLIGVSFKPGGGYPFFGVPSGELQDQNIPLEEFWKQQSHGVHERIIAARDVAAKFRILESALLARLNQRGAHSGAVAYAVHAFDQPETVSSVGAVVEYTGLSPRRFIAAFRDQVGLTPKAFCRVARFRRVIGHIGSSPRVDWADIALRCGYFDQAHFNHDFREFAGISPTEYILHRTASPNHVRILAEPP
jgi:AraC-like DNA-binding protein